MRRFVLTGMPGAGKTAIIQELEVDGFSVGEEAPTDIIAMKQAQAVAEPWTAPWFIDAVAALRRPRQIRASQE
jgi:predicted ATPase